jgi:hypothetical protein
MNVPDMSWIVQRKKYEPGVLALKTCVSVHGPAQLSP